MYLYQNTDIQCLEIKVPDKNIFWIILFLIAFPTSFFFNSLYTESLFLMFFVLSLYFYLKKKYLLSSVFSIFLSLTKFIGIFVSTVYLLISDKKKAISFFPILGSILGLFIYSAFLYKTTGDPFFFFNSQPFFGGNRSTDIILFPQVIFRYLKIFLTQDFNFQYFIAIVEIAFFLVVFITLLVFTYYGVKKKERILTGVNVFSLINLILPTLTGTFQSIPRYALLSLGFFIALSFIKNDLIKVAIFLTFILFHVILLSFFSQGYFVG